MFESVVPEKFPDLKCADCGAALPVGTAVRVQTDVNGWLLYAECKEDCQKAGSTVHAPGCPCGFCKAGFTRF